MPPSKVNLSAVPVADVPYPKNTWALFVSVRVDPDWTRTSTVPAAWAGAVTSSCVSETIWTELASTVPNRTWSWPAAPVKFLPVIVTGVPPAAGPLAALSPVSRGVRSTTSRSAAVIAWSWSTSSMFQLSDGVPWKYMSEPLSATISPYVFIAWAMALASGDQVDGMTKLPFNRNRSPIRGRSVPVRLLA